METRLRYKIEKITRMVPRLGTSFEYWFALGITVTDSPTVEIVNKVVADLQSHGLIHRVADNYAENDPEIDTEFVGPTRYELYFEFETEKVSHSPDAKNAILRLIGDTIKAYDVLAEYFQS